MVPYSPPVTTAPPCSIEHSISSRALERATSFDSAAPSHDHGTHAAFPGMDTVALVALVADDPALAAGDVACRA